MRRVSGARICKWKNESLRRTDNNGRIIVRSLPFYTPLPLFCRTWRELSCDHAEINHDCDLGRCKTGKMAVLKEGNTLFRAEPSHWNGQTGVLITLSRWGDRLINTKLIVRLATGLIVFDAILDTFHELFMVKEDHSYVSVYLFSLK